MPTSIGSSPLSSLGSSFSDEPNSSSQASSNAVALALASLRRPQAQPSGLPFEVLERVFRHTFLRPTYATPSSNPFPLRGTTHVLLVSKAFRRLALPSFFCSITISQPQDFLTFFQPKKGIFVAGEEAQRRWSYVREICVVSDPKLPLSTSTRATAKCLAALELPQTNFLERFCFLDYYTDFEFLYQLQKEELSSQKQKLAFDKEVQNTLTVFVQRLASDGTVLVLTSDFLQSLPSKADFGLKALKFTPRRLEVHDTLALAPSQAQEFIKDVKHVTEEKPVHLVGFSPLFVFRFEKELERMKRRDRGFTLEFSWDV